MQRALVISSNKQQLMPCHPARVRQLLREGKAAVYRLYPFTIIMKERTGGDKQPLTLKIDPGSKVTGISLVAECKRGPKVVWAMELQHRGQQIKRDLKSRRGVRRSRRNRNTWYRTVRFKNRRRSKGWLPPSLMSRVYNSLTWQRRLSRFAPITGLALELVKFDTQLMQSPEISGVEYQQGELAGYEVREYLLEKWEHKCAYCDADDVPLQVEHIHPKSKGGTDRISNLTLACRKCNDKKDKTDIRMFLKRKPELLAKILKQAKEPLKDAAAVNSTRWALYERLKATGLPVETGTGGRTKFNRTKQGYPKAHWTDAACVGLSGEKVFVLASTIPLRVEAKGHGSRQVCRVDQYGFPRTSAKGARMVKGFRSGDIVKAFVPAGARQGSYAGRVAVRTRGSFNIATGARVVTDISYKHCSVLHRADGYNYKKGMALLPDLKDGVPAPQGV